MPADESDRLLVAEVRKGDSSAWEELISRYEGRLIAFVDSRLRNLTASEDIVQEAFMGFLISLPNYDDKTPLESWLFTITAHKLTDLMRREGRRPTIPLFVPDSQGEYREPKGNARKASSMARSGERRVVEEKVMEESLYHLIQSWVDKEEYERMMCMELLFVLGWSNKKVAERLGLSEQAVANHKHFVVGKLKTSALAKLREFDPLAFGLE